MSLSVSFTGELAIVEVNNTPCHSSKVNFVYRTYEYIFPWTFDQLCRSLNSKTNQTVWNNRPRVISMPPSAMINHRSGRFRSIPASNSTVVFAIDVFAARFHAYTRKRSAHSFRQRTIGKNPKKESEVSRRIGYTGGTVRALAGSINQLVKYISHPAVRSAWISALYLRGSAFV